MSRLFRFLSEHDIGSVPKFYTDIIKRALLLVSERQSSVAIGNDDRCQRSMISVVTFV